MIRFHSITGLPRAAPGLHCATPGLNLPITDNEPMPSLCRRDPSATLTFTTSDCDTSSNYAQLKADIRGDKPYSFNEFTRNLRRRRR